MKKTNSLLICLMMIFGASAQVLADTTASAETFWGFSEPDKTVISDCELTRRIFIGATRTTVQSEYTPYYTNRCKMKIDPKALEYVLEKDSFDPNTHLREIVGSRISYGKRYTIQIVDYSFVPVDRQNTDQPKYWYSFSEQDVGEFYSPLRAPQGP